MAGQAKKVQIQLGLITIPVRLEKATDAAGSETKTVCAGTEENPHPPAAVKQSMGCTVCDITHSSHYPFPRGVPQGDGFVVVSADELAAAAGSPIKSMTFRLHDRQEVFAATVASDSVQYVTPDRGGERAFAALRCSLSSKPGLVAVTVWAPSTKNALWVLEVVNEQLVVSKRCWPEDVRTPPVVTPVEVPEVEQAMFDQFIEASVVEFDLSSYRDAAREGRAALIAERSGEAQPLAAAAATTPVVGGGDLLSAIQASLKAVEPTKAAPKKKAPARKRAAKKPAEPAA